jgi:RNA polymerase sigma-70 factor (ECF subfamily)
LDQAAIELVGRWQAGDQEAAAELFRRYTARLVTLARSRLSGKLNRRVDPEDVVQSAYRSFFVGVRAGEYRLGVEAELWGLLATITLYKLRRQVARHQAKKRNPACEQAGDEHMPFGVPDEILARDPSPLEALALVDQLEQVMRELSPLERQVLELRLKGHNLSEIASRLKRGLRTVCRAIDSIKQRLRDQQQAGDAGR